ncbi:MAG: hypothetical protein D6676_03580 [Cyanobacteria bacterium J003]|nr:MAG: hypothetical protein D6676_03580 [Cyanobacteria bacterium J003]
MEGRESKDFTSELIPAMDSPIVTPTTCRFCRFYYSEGRRGGTCEKLNVPVRGFWRACPLGAAIPARGNEPAIAARPSTTARPLSVFVFFSGDDPEAIA